MHMEKVRMFSFFNWMINIVVNMQVGVVKGGTGVMEKNEHTRE